MTEPGPDPHKRKTVPMHGIGQPHAARGRAEAHLLLHTLTVPPTPACREAAREEAGRPRLHSAGIEAVRWP